MSQPFTDAQLAAFLGGTLEDEALLDAIEAAINADPALAERAEALAAGDDPAASAVRDAFAPVLSAPVPDRLTAMLTPESADVVDLAAARAARPQPLPTPANDTAGSGSGWRWPQFGAMAASLALGVLIGGPLLKGGAADAPAGEGLVLASADLDTMLNTAASGQRTDLAALGEGEVVLTFRDGDGRVCRQFLIEQGGTTSDALACAGGAGDRWQIEAYGRRAAPAGEMKLAGGDAAPAVVAAVDAIIAGDPLIGADEAAVLGAK
jgi:hypothetical protein